MRCYLHRGMRPTDEYVPTTEGAQLPILTIGTGNGVDMTLTPRLAHTVMDLKYLLRAQEGLPLHTQTILVTWPARSTMESATTRVLNLVMSPHRDAWLTKLSPFQDLLDTVPAAPAHAPSLDVGYSYTSDLNNDPMTCQNVSACAAGIASQAAKWTCAVVSTSIHACLSALQQRAAEEQGVLQQHVARWRAEALSRHTNSIDGATELAPGVTSAGCLLFAVDTTLVVDACPRVLSYIGWDLNQYRARAAHLGIKPSDQKFWEMKHVYDHWHTETAAKPPRGTGATDNGRETDASEGLHGSTDVSKGPLSGTNKNTGRGEGGLATAGIKPTSKGSDTKTVQTGIAYGAGHPAHSAAALILAAPTETSPSPGSTNQEASVIGNRSRVPIKDQVACPGRSSKRNCPGKGSTVAEINRWLSPGCEQRPTTGGAAPSPTKTANVAKPGRQAEEVVRLNSVYFAENQSYRFCYPERAGSPPRVGISYCPHTTAGISILCSAILPKCLSSTVASRVVSLLAPHQHPETPPPHYPARPAVLLKICSLNKQLQHGAGEPLVQSLCEYKFHLGRFYNELYAVATNCYLPSAQDFQDFGSMVRTRMESIIQRRQNRVQLLQPGHVNVLLPSRPTACVSEPITLHSSHPLSIHLRTLSSRGNITPEFITKLGLSLAITPSASSESPPHSPVADDGAETGSQTANAGYSTHGDKAHHESSPAGGDDSDENYLAPGTASHRASA
jgi:hypothetical protein